MGAASLVVSLVVGLGVTGCAMLPRLTGRSDRFIMPYVLAMACDVEPLFVGQSNRVAMDAINRDFQAISRLGFDNVLLRHVDQRERLRLLDAARAVGLRVALADRGTQHYARTGSLPRGVGDHRDLTRRIPRDVVSHPALASLVVDVGESPPAAGRGETICAAIIESGSPCVLVTGESIQTNAPSLIRIDADVAGAGSNASLLELWLAQYHHGLTNGRTAGVVFDRYRRHPGDAPGMAPRKDASDSARIAALKALTARASLWGTRLQNLSPVQIQGGSGREPDLTTTAFIQGRRRYILVFNQSLEDYTRSEVVLPKLIDGSAVARAVEVPASRAGAAGRLIREARGTITLPVALRPGDAALFELF